MTASELSEGLQENLQAFMDDEDVQIERLRLQMDMVIRLAARDAAQKLSEDLMNELVQEFTDSFLDSLHNVVSLARETAEEEGE